MLLVLFALSMGATMVTRGAVRASVDVQPQLKKAVKVEIPQMPPDTEQKLSDALNPQRIPIPPAFLEVFVNRFERVNQILEVKSAPPASNEPPPIPDYVTRYKQWQARVRQARSSGVNAPPVTSVYLLEEIEPVGKSQARGRRSALIYIKPEQRTVAISVGTDFYDATLEAIDEQGLIFRTAGGLRTVEWADASPAQVNQNSTGERKQEARPEPPPARTNTETVYAQGDPKKVTRPRRVKPGTVKPGSTVARNQKSAYSVLQEAVRERYAKGKTAGQAGSTPDAKKVDSAKRFPVSRPRRTEREVAKQSFTNSPTVAVRGMKIYNDDYDDSLYSGVLYSGILGGRPSTDRSARRAIQPAVYRRSTSYETTSPYEGEGGRVAHVAVGWGVSQDGAANARPRRVTQKPDPTKKKEQPAAGGPAATQSGETQSGDPGVNPNVEVFPLASNQEETRKTRRVEQPAAPPSPPAVDNPQQRATPDAENPGERKPSGGGSDQPEKTADETGAGLQPGNTRGTFCDPRFDGELIDLDLTRATLIDLTDFLHKNFSVNFFVDPDVQKTPVRLNIEKAGWPSVLRTVLKLNDLDAECLAGNIIQIAARSKIAKLQDERAKSAPLVREVFKLKYLQPVSGGRLNLAGQLQSGQVASIQTLEDSIRRIIKAGNDTRGDVTRVPGRSEFIVVGTAEQIAQIRELIERVDRPGYQVVIHALIYTVNDTKVKDIGPQISAIVGNTSQSTLGGITTLPNARPTNGGGGQDGGGGSGTGKAGRNPGGIGGLGEGFTQPGSGLSAIDPTGIVGITTIVGTAQFSAQLSLAVRKNAANIQARPFGTIENGNQLNLVAGSTIPVLSNTVAGGGLVPVGNIQFIEASRVLRITPQVAEGISGRPEYVTLDIQIENNSIDPSKGTFNALPVLERQSLQTTLRLKAGETAVIGGLAADSVARATTSIPLVGDVPILGRLFRREFSQIDRGKLYFALTAIVIEQGAPMLNPPVPADATTAPPPPPPAQNPGPYEKKQD